MAILNKYQIPFTKKDIAFLLFLFNQYTYRNIKEKYIDYRPKYNDLEGKSIKGMLQTLNKLELYKLSLTLILKLSNRNLQ